MPWLGHGIHALRSLNKEGVDAGPAPGMT